MRGLDDLVRTGKILYVWISDTPAWVVSRANLLAELRGWIQFVGLQIEFSLIERTVERELLPMARALGLAVTPWGAIGGGILTGKYSKAKSEATTWRYSDDERPDRINDRSLAIADEVVAIAKETGCSPAQVAVNWVRQQAGLMIPIVGARTNEQLRQNLECLDHSLSDEHLRRLDEISRIELGFPHDFLSKDFIRDLVYAGTYDSIDNHRA